MTTVKQAAQTLRERLDLRDLVRQLVPGWTPVERRDGADELHGPCPRCRAGEDRFYVGRTYAACRRCHEKRMDAVGLVAWLNGVTQEQAVRMLDAGALEPVHVFTEQTPVKTEKEREPGKGLQYALQDLPRAQVRLFLDEGAPARQYLLSRALQPDAWKAFGLGFTRNKTLPSDRDLRAPAVLWPVVDEQTQEPCVVRYRFLPGASTGDRYDSFGSMRGRLFGVQCLPEFALMPWDESERLHAEASRCLVIVEGELNAMSVWQACHLATVDVLSTGSQSITALPAWSVAVASHYGVTLTWLDEPARAARVAQQLPRAVPVSSPAQDGKKLDANEMLQRGLLGAFVQSWRLRALTTEREREGVLWDLWDVQDELDAGQVQLGKRLAQELGKQW